MRYWPSVKGAELGSPLLSTFSALRNGSIRSIPFCRYKSMKVASAGTVEPLREKIRLTKQVGRTMGETILIVDDDEDLRRMYRTACMLDGY